MRTGPALAASISAALLTVLVTQGHAQEERIAPGFGGPGQGNTAEATIYRDPGFQGPAVAISRPDPDVRLAWPVRSVRVASGYWQLCTSANYSGNCIVVTRDEANLTGKLRPTGMLRSIRPISNGPGGGGPGGGGPGGGGSGSTGGGWGSGGSGGGNGSGWGNPGQSLRGMAAEFFPQPLDGNRRVLACRRGSASASCAAQTADAFCRQRGWAGSARQALETENRQVYLADVLCTRTGN